MIIWDGSGLIQLIEAGRAVRTPEGRTAEQQLRRFLGTKKGRKIHYGRVLVEALDPGRVPEPLDGLLAVL